MHPNAALIQRFYTCFQKRDAAGMAACYHPQVQISDPAFPDLRGPQAAAMWAMLAERGKDLQLEFRDVRADDRGGSAHWEARYTFTKTGRKVHNVIDASFEFRDGLIVKHTDRFDFARWASQALGPMGMLLGRTGWLQKKVQVTAAQGLAEYSAKKR